MVSVLRSRCTVRSPKFEALIFVLNIHIWTNGMAHGQQQSCCPWAMPGAKPRQQVVV
jgi:hypothetical protein